MRPDPEGDARAAWQAFSHARHIGDTLGKAWAMHHGSALALNQDKLPLSAWLARRAEPIFVLYGENYGLGSVLNTQGIVQYRSGYYAEAAALFHRSLASVRHAEHLQLRQATMVNIGLALRDMGEFGSALQWFLAALEHSEDDTEVQLQVMAGLAGLRIDANDLVQTSIFAEQVILLTSAVSRSGRKDDLAIALALMVHLQGEPARALALTSSVVSRGELGNTFQVQGFEVAFLFALGRVSEAETRINTLLSRADIGAAERAGPDGAAELHQILAQIYSVRRQWDMARMSLNTAQDLSDRRGSAATHVKVILRRVELEEAAGAYAEALKYSRLHHQLDHALLNHRETQRAQYLMVEHEVRRHRALREQLARANADLEDLIRHDALTHTLNRRTFLKEAQTAFTPQTSMTTTSFSPGKLTFVLMLIDIDSFKQVNAVFGHSVGDAVLKQVAVISQNVLHTGQLLTRWGDGQFAALFPSMDQAGAVQIAERLGADVQDFDWTVLGAGLQVTVSLGLGVWPPADGVPDVYSLLGQVDQVLHASKQAGHNQIVQIKPG